MLVGTTAINYEELKEFAGKPKELVTYVCGLVPTWARNIPNIVANQRFYVALHIRKILTLPYQVRTDMVNALVEGINLSGVISNVVSITDIIDMCDKKALAEMLKLEIQNERH